MEFIMVLLVACVVFAFCFAVFLLKGRKDGAEPRLHGCGHTDDGCHCRKASSPPAAGGRPTEGCCDGAAHGSQSRFDLLEVLEKAKRQDS